MTSTSTVQIFSDVLSNFRSHMRSILRSSTNRVEMDSRRFSNSPTMPSSELNASLPQPVTVHIPELSLREQGVIAWMRAHPDAESFKVESCKISAIDSCEHSTNSHTSLVPYSRRRDDHYERIDFSDEPDNRESRTTSSRHNPISPGTFSAVSGSQRIISRRSGGHLSAQKQKQTHSSFRHGHRHSGFPRRPFSTSSANEGTTRVAGASVLQGASNFVINGSNVAPGAFCAIAGDQEIWVD
ncbi:hypothetical protein D9757_006869 [Collybiopsis confluens]|uniref:Uncharacterized protein n=1 Tax=Collybiopsis confluens TaxID=2823264 RepID=A0A8H5HPL0_9AGAR|nr:hypothetical protein D9757_006869 [Collybiopsis confluens]